MERWFINLNGNSVIFLSFLFVYRYSICIVLFKVSLNRLTLLAQVPGNASGIH